MSTTTKAAKFSVLLLLPDYLADNYGQDTFFTHTEAPTVAEAISAAQSEAAEAYNEPAPERTEPADFHPLLAIMGWHCDAAVQP